MLKETLTNVCCGVPAVRYRERSGRGEHHAAQWSREVLHSEWGYSIGRRHSNIPGAGRGVFVTDGVVCKGQVVALYPGTLYHPGERLLIQSIRNPFILRCSDGVMVDGRDTGLSRSIYK